MVGQNIRKPVSDNSEEFEEFDSGRMQKWYIISSTELLNGK